MESLKDDTRFHGGEAVENLTHSSAINTLCSIEVHVSTFVQNDGATHSAPGHELDNPLPANIAIAPRPSCRISLGTDRKYSATSAEDLVGKERPGADARVKFVFLYRTRGIHFPYQVLFRGISTF